MEDLISAQQKLFQEAKLSFDPWESREKQSDCAATSPNPVSKVTTNLIHTQALVSISVGLSTILQPRR